MRGSLLRSYCISCLLFGLSFWGLGVGAVLGLGRFSCCSVFMAPTADMLKGETYIVAGLDVSTGTEITQFLSISHGCSV